MQTPVNIDVNEIIFIAAIVLGIGLLLSLALLAWIIWKVRKIQLPPDADALTALRATPLVVVLLLDVLDLTLDFLSAPFSWTLLNYLGLKPLRNVALVESLIPFTQFVPTMTIAWIVARLTRPN